MQLRNRTRFASAALLVFTALASACAPDAIMSPRSGGALGSAPDTSNAALISRWANPVEIGVASGRVATDRVATDRVATDRVATDRVATDRVALGSCDRLRAPAGSTIAFHAYARGVQIYRWNGSAWTFVAPDATLSASANDHGVIGTHYAGPTWESRSGSLVTGAVLDRCTPDMNAIPWLSLTATSIDAPGVFARVVFIQRVNTVGGLVPSVAGTAVGEIARVPYAAEYWFYRAP